MTVHGEASDHDPGAHDQRASAPPFLEAGIDFESANAARMYDYLLGGGHNFPVDRELVRQAIEANPGVQRLAQQNRMFLGRVVGWCAERGIDQFLDLGSGVPTVGNVHEVAQHLNPDARVAYVDFEPVAVAHAEEILRDVPNATITRADLRDPASVLAADTVAGLLDFTRPVALLAVSVLHFVPDGVDRILVAYRAALAPGSVVALSHSSADYDDADLAARVRAAIEVYARSATPAVERSRRQIRHLLDGLDLVEPGLVDVADWPTGGNEPTGNYGAVAVVPDRGP